MSFMQHCAPDGLNITLALSPRLCRATRSCPVCGRAEIDNSSSRPYDAAQRGPPGFHDSRCMLAPCRVSQIAAIIISRRYYRRPARPLQQLRPATPEIASQFDYYAQKLLFS